MSLALEQWNPGISSENDPNYPDPQNQFELQLPGR
jgi:hypothetical protein